LFSNQSHHKVCPSSPTIVFHRVQWLLNSKHAFTIQWPTQWRDTFQAYCRCLTAFYVQVPIYSYIMWLVHFKLRKLFWIAWENKRICTNIMLNSIVYHEIQFFLIIYWFCYRKGFQKNLEFAWTNGKKL